ncbi:7,8-didemethyl-8-hydroxy-5-deazariboflavin synthase subunit CofG [bacterium]|nr:7,8-didemethyl-8-hydroxy-5-deazariboflavin synthase subunit CofG [bacterium]
MLGYSNTPTLEEDEEDNHIFEEVGSDVITYSPSHSIIITRRCRNKCPYCVFNRLDNKLTVPYSTIKPCKAIRQLGVREVIYMAGERPDKFPEIRSSLDIWGFGSYLEYLYTMAELGFLEGLIPIIEVGFLSPTELKKMSEIAALIKIPLDSVDDKHFNTVYPNSPGKQLEIRLRSLEWTGKLNVPTIASILVGAKETKSHRKEQLTLLAELHNRYGHIHEVSLQNFIPIPGTPFSGRTAATQKTMLETVELAKSILPESVSITVPIHLVENISDFIKAGIRDFGSIPIGRSPVFPNVEPINFEDLVSETEKAGFRLHQRFPLRFPYIKDGHYSKKLGQVFDSYKYKIKKHDQEKLKDLKK